VRLKAWLRRGFPIPAAVLLIWLALWVAGPRTSLPVPSASPSTATLGKAPQLFGSIYLCSFDAPYRAYALRGYSYYPPNHPLLPDPEERPDRCFGSAVDAEDAGYSAAQGPYGTQVVDGVYLMPNTDFDPNGSLASSCLRAARRLGFAVPCPTLLPNGRPGVDPPRCGAPGAFLPTRPPCVVEDLVFLFEESGFAVPPGYALGGVGSGASLLIGAYRVGKGALGGGYEPYYANSVLCPEAQVVQTIPLDRSLDRMTQVRGRLVVCAAAESALDGYLILRWEEGGVIYLVALVGDTQTNRDLLNAISAGVKLVEPMPKTPAP
jgi:hypothetical protein